MTHVESWHFENPVRIIAGPGTIDRLPDVVYGRPLLITSPGATARGLTGRVADLLVDRHPLVYDRAPSHPTLDDLEHAVATLRHERFDCVLAVGGGSVIDFGKALSAAAAQSAPALDEMIRDGIPAALQTFDVVAVPTTAGTGSEVTPFATIWDAADRRKLSLASPKVFPKIAIIDPEPTHSLSWESTLGPGLDALIQCFEAIWNVNAAPVPTALAIRGIGLVPDALRALHVDLAAPGPRASMQEAAILSGMAISQTRTALAHSMSYPITAHLGVPHGFACAWVLPGVMAFNLANDDGRMGPVARELGIADPASLTESMVWLMRELGADVIIRRLAGPDAGGIGSLADAMLSSDRAQNNIRPPGPADIKRILEHAADWVFEAT